jgi:alkanesulfonate monooxygenase SsuD/methylene tetrahydromethanopterin reductase-like flavin-dependent oxidoreductase (luciferase family)
MAAATVDHLSRGRFILGLGSSHRVQVEPEHGIPFVQPTARLRDTIAIVRALVREGVVSHRGETVTIERFDLWFPPRRPHIPIYMAALFPRMLEIAGELSQGVLLTWPTEKAIARAVEHVAIGARQAGRPASEVDVGSLIPCAVADTSTAARDLMRPAVGLYAGFFPRYNRLLAETGFGDAVRSIKEAYDRGGREAAAKVVPDELIDAVALAGTPETCRDRLAAYRRAGLALPIVSPRVSGAAARKTAMAAIRACAP